MLGALFNEVYWVSSFHLLYLFFLHNQKRQYKKREKKGEWGTVLATVPFPKASTFLVGACSSYLQTNQKKIKIKKRGNGRRKVVKVLRLELQGWWVKVWVMTIKGMQSRGKRNTQIEVRKTFIGRMGFIHE